MQPFDRPPTTPPVSFDPPSQPPSGPPAPRRGRMVIVGLATAGLLGGAVIGVSALVSADDTADEPGVDLAAGAAVGADDGSVGDAASAQPDVRAAADDDSDDESDDDSHDVGGDPDDGDTPHVSGQIVIEGDDGEPVVIDLGQLFGDGTIDGGALADCVGLPLGGLTGDLDGAIDLGRLLPMPDGAPGPRGGFVVDGPFGGADVTVLGPDGPTVVDLGDGDGSVTISRDGDTGELTITTEGTATSRSLDDVLGDLHIDVGDLGDLPELGDLPDLGDLGDFGDFDIEDFRAMLDELLGEIDTDHLPRFEGFDPTAIADCLAELADGSDAGG